MNKLLCIILFLTTIVPLLFINCEFERNELYKFASESEKYYDPSAPVPGDNGYIEIKQLDASTIELFWSTAWDNDGVTPDSELEYTVFQAESDNNLYNYYDAQNSDAMPILQWTKNVSSARASGLNGIDSGMVYYFNVFVMDGDGNISSYNGASTNDLDTGGEGDSYLYIVSTSPPKDATGVDPSMPITVVFSEDLNTTTLYTNGPQDACSAGTFVISYDGFSTCLMQSMQEVMISVDWTEFYLDGASLGLQYGTTYTVMITTDVISLNGNSLETNYTWSFTTMAK